MKYVVLRNVAGAFLKPSKLGGDATPDTFAPEVVEQPLGRLSELSQNTKDLAAPVMRLKLIGPHTRSIGAGPIPTTVPWGVSLVGADSCPFRGAGAHVAVLDTGIHASHEAFAAVRDRIVWKDFSTAAAEDPTDSDGHGTHCAGTVFGGTVNGVRIGIAPDVAKAHVARVFEPDGSSSTDTLVNAIHWAVSGGAQIISMSLGLDFPGLVEDLIAEGVPTTLATSMALEGYRSNVQLFERVASLAALFRSRSMPGTLLVAAAGNESRRDLSPDYKLGVAPPAVAEGIVSVGAVMQGAEDKLCVAPFSNTGATVVAPGFDVLSAVPGGVCTMSGTSMATPHVAGVAALFVQKITNDGGRVTPSEVRARLMGTADRSSLDASITADVGCGLVRAPT